jgi:hypothetical protein
MEDKEDPSERHREMQKDPWEIKMTRGRFKGSGRKSGRSRGGTWVWHRYRYREIHGRFELDIGRSGPDTGDSGRYKRSGGDTQGDLWEIKKIWVRDVERSREISWEMKMTRARYRGSGRKSGRLGGST